MWSNSRPRGPHASMIGRTMAIISGLGADLQPAGWRLTDAPGIDHRRATSLLAQDLDTVEEADALGWPDRSRSRSLARGHWRRRWSDRAVTRCSRTTGRAATSPRRWPKACATTSATYDVGSVRAEIIVQIDEPALPAVLTGAIPTASGFSRHRSVSNPMLPRRSAG